MNLRNKFLNHVERNWKQNNHSLKNISCVYLIAGYDPYKKTKDIYYVGSTVRLELRYRSHKIPEKVQSIGLCNILYYLPMESGFYDYEMKLIKTLKPLFNKQHKNG